MHLNEDIVIAYHSHSGNTEEVAHIIKGYFPSAIFIDIEKEPIPKCKKLIFGTFTWGNGNIPKQSVIALRDYINTHGNSNLPSLFLFGTGDTQFRNFCGALPAIQERWDISGGNTYYTHLKIEQSPSRKDKSRIIEWCGSIIDIDLELDGGILHDGIEKN